MDAWLGSYDPVRSAGTIRLYGRVAREFLAFLARRELGLTTAAVEDLSAWRDSFVGAESTRGTRLAIIRALYSFAVRAGYLPRNVARLLRAPKVHYDPDARYLSEDEVSKLVDAARLQLDREKARVQPRPRYLRASTIQLALVRLLYASALRISEVVSADWSDLRERPDGSWILSVKGKGGRRRAVPLPGLVIRDLRHTLLIGARDGRIIPVGPRRAEAIVARLAVAAGIARKVSPHHLRHASATHAVERGAPLHVVQRSLGHASLATTSVYLHAHGRGASEYLMAV